MSNRQSALVTSVNSNGGDWGEGGFKKGTVLITYRPSEQNFFPIAIYPKYSRSAKKSKDLQSVSVTATLHTVYSNLQQLCHTYMANNYLVAKGFRLVAECTDFNSCSGYRNFRA